MIFTGKMFVNPNLFNCPAAEIRVCGSQNLTYGSLTTRGVQQMAARIAAYMRDESVHGFDLGCGDGELIYHLGLALPDSKWEGVEISEHRVQQQQRDVCIWQGNMLEENLRPYNVLHADNLCLEDEVAAALEAKIAIEFQGLYITYRSPMSTVFRKCSVWLETAVIETTWTQHPIHFYMVY